MAYLTLPEIEALVTAIRTGLPSMYKTVQPSDRQEAFAAEANGILDLTAPEDHLLVFAKLESLVIRERGARVPAQARTGHGHRLPVE